MDYLSNIGFQVFKHPSKLVRRGSARVQDRNKQGKKLFFTRCLHFFSFLTCLFGLKKLSRNLSRFLITFQLSLFPNMVSQIFLSLQAFFFFFIIFLQYSFFFTFWFLGVRNAVNLRNCEFYLVYHDSRLCVTELFI